MPHRIPEFQYLVTSRSGTGSVHACQRIAKVVVGRVRSFVGRTWRCGKILSRRARVRPTTMPARPLRTHALESPAAGTPILPSRRESGRFLK